MLNFVKWLLWDFTGIRFVFRKFLPPKYSDTGGRPPSTIIFWLIGTYLVSYAVAYQRYENRVGLIESRANTIFQLLSSTDTRKFAISRIPTVQNSLDTPMNNVKPIQP